MSTWGTAGTTGKNPRRVFFSDQTRVVCSGTSQRTATPICLGHLKAEGHLGRF